MAGSAMDTKLASSYSNIVMSNFEDICLLLPKLTPNVEEDYKWHLPNFDPWYW